MNNKEEKPVHFVPTKIENSIFRKIKFFSKTEKIPSFIESEEAKKFENANHKKVAGWKINDSVCIIPEPVDLEPTSRDKENNDAETVNFIENSFGTDYVVITFRKIEKISRFKRCLSFENVNGFNLAESHKIAQICNFLIKSTHKKVIVIEIRKAEKFSQFFTIACILAHCNFFQSAEIALNYLMTEKQSFWDFSNFGTTLRYTKYFDIITSQCHLLKSKHIALNHIIITTDSSFSKYGDFLPELLISNNLTTLSNITFQNCYKDNDCLIFTDLQTEIKDDIKISLKFKQKEKTDFFDLHINSLFYHQDLFRFSKSDIITSLPQKEMSHFFQDGFCIDLVFHENQNDSVLDLFPYSLNIMELINLMTDHFSGNSDEEKYRNFIIKKFNQQLARFCSQMNLSEEDSMLLYESLEKLKHKNDQPKELQLIPTENTLIIDENVIEESHRIPNHENKDIVDDAEFGDIPLLEDTLKPIDQAKSCSFNLFSRRKATVLPSLSIRENIFAKKPLHLMSLSTIENTVFYDIKDINIKMDLNIVERIFCDDETSESVKIIEKKVKYLGIDQKRVFIVSLLLKKLEFKKITLEKLEDIFINAPESLSLEDLQCILKILPTEEDLVILEKLEDYELSEIEQKMLKLSKITEIKQILQILIFEISFLEEISLFDKLLNTTNNLIDEIICNQNLKFIFKIILQLTNRLNYTYGRSRKLMNGFKLESLYLIIAYGESRGKTLIDFIIDTLMANNIQFENIFNELRNVEKLKNEDYSDLKEKINDIITKYNDVNRFLKSLEFFDRTIHNTKMIIAYKELLAVIEQYKTYEIKSRNLRIKMGEKEKEPINCIFKSLADFLKYLEASNSKMKANTKKKESIWIKTDS